MKKIIISILSTVIVLLGGYNVAQDFGGVTDVNSFHGVSSTATTTHSYESYCENCPVKLLDNDAGRRYARIENTGETGQDVWIYLAEPDAVLNLALTSTTTLADEAFGVYYSTTGGYYTALATSTIVGTDLHGGMIRLSYPTSSARSFYEIDADNLHLGEVWATSTATTTVSVIYR